MNDSENQRTRKTQNIKHEDRMFDTRSQLLLDKTQCIKTNPSTQTWQEIIHITTHSDQITTIPGASVQNMAANRSRLYRERHKEEINQRRRDKRNRQLHQKHILSKVQNEINQNNQAVSDKLNSNSHSPRQKQYYNRHKEKINKDKRDERLKQNITVIPITAAERNRKYRERNREEINERRRDSRLIKNLHKKQTECIDKIKYKMEEQAEKQTNEKNHKTNTTEKSNDSVRKRKVNELDKFKRRLIRAIARLLYTENKAEADIWDDLKTETGCDCELLWSRMRALTIKKLVRLFTAEDKLENITKIARLSVTDWLLFDLVLVHEKVDVIGQELVNKEEPSFLRDLFNLVEEHNIECDMGEALVTKWFDATAKYNNIGKRQCSPMLLQKRWYQLKERSRSNFYNFWFQYRGDSRKLEKANEYKPSDLQLDIVKRYKEIVTKPFINWEDLIKERRVALPEDFERLRLARNEITMSETEPDLEVIEPQVETIDLEETNDSMTKDTNNEEGFNDFNIDIVKIESLAEQEDDVSVLESVHIPLEKTDSVDINSSDGDVVTTKSLNDNDLVLIESDSEPIMPKIASITSTAHLESCKDNDTNDEIHPKEILDIEDSEMKATSLAAVNNILEQIVKNVVEHKMNAKFDEKFASTIKAKGLDLDKNIEDLSLNIIIDLDKDETKRPDTQDNAETSIDTGVKYDLNIDIGFDDISNNINFIDDGIELVDDGIEYLDEDCMHEYKLNSDINTEIIEATNEEESTIDLKLLLTPVVYTKKLDDMDVFRFIDYNTVKDDRVLQNAVRESKPKDNKSFNMKEMLQETNHDDSSNAEAELGDVIPDDDIVKSGEGLPDDGIAKTSEIIPDDDIAKTSGIIPDDDIAKLGEVIPNDDIVISSWLFRKPKVNNYNPIQLCKNPDFNTRLKRLGAAFYTSQRNRLQLKKCKPLTVDLHKTFESKLINNKLYLNKSRNNSYILNDMIETSCKTELSDKIEPSNDNEIATHYKMTIEQSEIHTERKKVINLPDKDQIRRVNQGLLVAEVSPIQASNPKGQEKMKHNNLVVESVNKLMDSTVIDKEMQTPPDPANVSQFSIQTDKLKAVSEKNKSELIESINGDIEQSEILSSMYSVMNNTKYYRRHHRKFFPKPKPYSNKYLELSWLPKPQPVRTDVIDCLLAADTVERILSLCKNDYISQDPKVLKPRRKQKTAAEKKKNENQVRKNAIQAKKNEKEALRAKKNKCRMSITTQTTNIKNVCCWSRLKIENFYKINTAKHYCAYNRCVCCCKTNLEAKERAAEQKKRCELIILSDDESITITAQTHCPVSKVTIGTNTDYDKDFEDQFAANLNFLKENGKQAFTPVISLPLGNLPQAVSNESGCQTPTPNKIEKPAPPAVLHNKITETSTQKQKNHYKVPICLGKNKILLCSFKPTTDADAAQKLNTNNKNSQSEQMLPVGCHLVLLPNRELALSIDPGVEFDSNQLTNLPSLIASVQKQINVIPTAENILEPYNVTLNEETVIHLSDDENSSIKDNSDIHSSTSESIPIETHIDSSDANKVTDVGAITKEERQISNGLTSPKESCNMSKSVTLNNSTITDTENVIEESSNEITMKDNGEEVIDSSNNTEENGEEVIDSTNNTEENGEEVIDSSNNTEENGEEVIDSTNNTEDTSGGNKKTILSDLMEMSGISTDDINVTNNDINVTNNDITITNNDINVTNNDINGTNNVVNAAIASNNESVSIIQQVFSQSDNSTSALQREYANITRKIGINPIMNNLVVRAALSRCSELNIVSSFPELKFAYENAAQFFKMDIANGIIVPINVCIKKDFEQMKTQRRKGISKDSKSVIDLTKDNEFTTRSSNIQPLQLKMTINQTNQTFDEAPENIQSTQTKNPIKPIKMFKAVHPSILRHSGRSLLVRPLKNSTMIQNNIGVTKHKRRQHVKKLNLNADNKLKAKNKIYSDVDSDEEPLAKKAKRLKDNLERDTKTENDSSLMDNDINYKESATVDLKLHMPSRFEPIVFDDKYGHSSDDDCILGV